MLNSSSETGNHCHIGHLEKLGPLRADNALFSSLLPPAPSEIHRSTSDSFNLERQQQKQNGISCAHAMDHLNWAATHGHNQVLFWKTGVKVFFQNTAVF